MRISYRTAAAAALLAAGSALTSINAQALEFQGVTFTSTVLGNMLTIEIDAAGRTGNWENAGYIGAIQVGDIGQFTFGSVAIGGLGFDWAATQAELSGSPTGNACAGGPSSWHYCFSGTPQALGDDMMFTFTAPSDIVGTSPHLKVAFYNTTNTSGGPDGDLLSQNVPAVPEPGTYAMLLAGLGLLGFMARRARKL